MRADDKSLTPYDGLPARAFWRAAVSEPGIWEIDGLWSPKSLYAPDDVFATAGSCFAQHIGAALVRNGLNWLDGEPAPLALSAPSQRAFNYGVFSFRTGNIYTPRLLRQWLTWAKEPKRAPDEAWEEAGRFFDPFRPAIEPGGFCSREEMLASRRETLRAIAGVARDSSVFIFTLGLTEAWENPKAKVVYPMCPGTHAGTFDASLHRFVNFDYIQCLEDLRAAFELLREFNPDIRMLLTVSPVPLTATASGKHVLAATTYSKSVLRAAAEAMVADNDAVDYFPSFEIIQSFPSRGMFFEPNLRSVSPNGVDFVMRNFFRAQPGLVTQGEDEADRDARREQRRSAASRRRAAAADEADEAEGLVCEDEFLSAFDRGASGARAGA